MKQMTSDDKDSFIHDCLHVVTLAVEAMKKLETHPELVHSPSYTDIRDKLNNYLEWTVRESKKHDR